MLSPHGLSHPLKMVDYKLTLLRIPKHELENTFTRHLMSICAPIQMMSHLFSFLALIHIPHMYRILPECFHFEAHLNSYLCLFPQPPLSH